MSLSILGFNINFPIKPMIWSIFLLNCFNLLLIFQFGDKGFDTLEFSLVLVAITWPIVFYTVWNWKEHLLEEINTFENEHKKELEDIDDE